MDEKNELVTIENEQNEIEVLDANENENDSASVVAGVVASGLLLVGAATVGYHVGRGVVWVVNKIRDKVKVGKEAKQIPAEEPTEVIDAPKEDPAE